jgi:hypothetical protein
LLDSYHDHIDEGVDNKSVTYPAMALFTSISIAILQFFYFGTSLAATEYFFSSVQRGTGLKFVQAHPWMLYGDAAPMRHLSIPWLLILVFGLPFSFLFSCWKLRHKINSPLVATYVGSLFRKYSGSCYWWEIMNVVKKLTIALLIRGISASNPFQPALIIVAIGTFQLLQAVFGPWRRRLENMMDPVGGTLLISSLFAASVSSDSTGVLVMILTLDGLYVVSLCIMITYHCIVDETEYQKHWNLSHQDLSNSCVDLSKVDEPLLRQPFNDKIMSGSLDGEYSDAPTDSDMDE